MICVVFRFQQSPRHVVHLVPESAQVDAIHSVAQLSLDHSESNHFPATRSANSALLLQYARLHGEKNDRSLNSRHLSNQLIVTC